MSKSIYKPRPVSGFPEWLPEVRALELSWLDHIRKVFESYGFVNIETPAVEEIDVLLSKGETDKEIYVLNRLQADERDKSDARLALHFDLTVPFARYTAQHFNDLTFPFKRYQIQKVWRGERPQEGRFREFYQCDIDIINPDNLPIHFDAEIPAVIDEILQGFDIPAYTIYINNRKILLGYMQGIGLNDKAPMALRILDKRDKIGVDGVKKELKGKLQLDDATIEKAVALAVIKGNTSIVLLSQIAEIKHHMHDAEGAALFAIGVDELLYVLDSLSSTIATNIVADLSIVRGFDYYTGTVYETKFNDHPDLGTVVAGGRYADLASGYINKNLPGVGISIGLTRMLSLLIAKGLVKPVRASKTDVLITVFDEFQRSQALKTAAQMRSRDLNVEVYHSTQKFQKQMEYADKKEIPYVWFLPADGKGDEVKNMATREQIAANPDTWVPS
jgi:histidyl-tRNA synthetase